MTSLSMICWSLSVLSLILGVCPVLSQSNQASLAVNIANLAESAEIVEFHVALINRWGLLDRVAGTLTVPFDGLYLVSLSAGHAGDARTEYSLIQGQTRMTTLFRNEATSADRAAIIGKDVIMWFNSNQELSIRSDGPRLLSDENSLATSWGTFSLSGDMGTTVGFGAARSTPHGIGKVTFDTTWGNVGNAWDSGTSTFTTPTTGIYYFSFSTGVSIGDPVAVYLQIGGLRTFRVFRETQTNVEVDSLQRAVMLQLFAGQTVEIVSQYAGFSNANHLTTFSGFLYNTERAVRLAWSVFRNSPLDGSQDPLQFPQVEVNEGAAWEENHAICLFSGLYYVHISGLTSDIGNFTLAVMREDEVMGELTYQSPDNVETVSRSLIIPCHISETIKVRATGYINSEAPDRDINFLGFYMFP